MSEFMDVMAAEDTTPEAAATESTGNPVDTTAEVPTEVLPEDTTPTVDPTETEAQPGEASPPPITVKHNHQFRQLTAEEAVSYAQKGIHYEETVAPMMEKLRFVSAGSGKTVSELVDGLMAANEEAMHNRFLEEAHGDESVARRLLEHERARLKAAYESSVQTEREQEQQAEQSLTDRLAAEFLEIQGDFPDIKEFKEIPQSVVNEAIGKNISLYDAYLRHHYSEQKRINQNKAAQEAAAKATTGSQADTPNSGESDPLISAMMSGVWG